MLLSNIQQTLSLQCYVIVEYPTKVIPSMLCHCRISYKRYHFNVMLLSNISYNRYPFNVMLLSNILQMLSLQCYVIVKCPVNVIPSMLCYCCISYKTLSLQCYVNVEYRRNVITSMLCYCRISHKRYPFNVMLLSNVM